MAGRVGEQSSNDELREVGLDQLAHGLEGTYQMFRVYC
jgi:hypothetical protein